MTFSFTNPNCFSNHLINHFIFLGDSTRPFARKVMFKGFWFSNPFIWRLFYGFKQTLNFLLYSYISRLFPIFVVVDGIRKQFYVHSSSTLTFIPFPFLAASSPLFIFFTDRKSVV